MAHKTLIGGTAYKIKGGRDLINGTGYDKKQGKTLVNGTALAISFAPTEYVMTLTGSAKAGTITYKGEAQNETFAVAIGDSITVKASVSEPYYMVRASVYLNGNMVADSRWVDESASVAYVYTPSANAIIERTRSSNSSGKKAEIKITEE